MDNCASPGNSCLDISPEFGFVLQAIAQEDDDILAFRGPPGVDLALSFVQAIANRRQILGQDGINLALSDVALAQDRLKLMDRNSIVVGLDPIAGEPNDA